MRPIRKLSRRSFVAAVAGGSISAGGALVLLSGRAEALQLTDHDPGDPQGRGTLTGLYDRDPEDPAGRGTLSRRTDRDPTDRPDRGRVTRSSITDGDKNQYQDATGGRGCSDADAGPQSDPLGRGRGTGITDADRGASRHRGHQADRAGCGRRR